MGVIIARREAQSKVVFFRQTGLTVEYSFDKIQWFTGFTLPYARPYKAGNQPLDPSRSARYYIEMYRSKYYLETNVSQIVNNFSFSFTRNEFIQNAPDLERSQLTPGKICSALKAFLESAREYGIAINNGSIEPDDLRRAWTVGSAIVGGIVAIATGGTFGAAAAGLFGAGVGAGVDQVGGEYLDWVTASSQWSDEQLEEYLCCLWDILKDGDFNYQDFVDAGTTCQIGAWDEIATPELYASFVAGLKHLDAPNDCPCETCLYLKPADGQIITGTLVDTSLLTQNNVISGSLRRMQARVKFTIPNMTITAVSVWVFLKPYESTADSTVPTIQFIAPNTGGGFTDIPITAEEIPLNPAHFGQTPTTEFDLLLQSSTCSACTTAQNALFIESYGFLTLVKICGVLA